MPESRRRKPKYTGPTGRQKIAAIDGTVVMIKACCRIRMTIGQPRCSAEHADGCRVPTDQTDEGKMRRLQVTMILRQKLQEHGIRSTVVTDLAGSGSILLVHPGGAAS
jgi:hypothetical protein